ncbi:MAG: thermonuclease family protein [Okeania sp. SIO2G4]|uniref:thermonuclease family protein n=1 Tax=unclassified Okeania TaxID=2634635 RepID=UPI0013B6B462|nr:MULTISPECIES: thermonuclease family protein [unclassified Okeania]NEP03425.1 thermonuclease family protein [Okeania sp. SIO4D6]NEP45921.1 thermonuclease family protein [Okeania sp. SIO2H7]NEP73928.1 thermonuclease family protein [Okeania sp. SIO2G5]NEP94742.1 thermonuclease family protein [Okeania sp. SIO2F5]NEQ94380.1 thermonuclease family protein [Okeania sp. SIO2G4]
MKKHKISLILTVISCGILILLSLLNTPESLATQQARISQIIDGDTVDISLSQCRVPWKGNSQLCRIRLACINTPERGEKPFFDDAKNRIAELLPIGTKVTIRDTGDTSYNRMVAEIFKDNTSINLQLVSEGKASLFCKHLNDTCPSLKTAYLNAQNSAKQAGLGIWNSRQPWQKARICN